MTPGFHKTIPMSAMDPDKLEFKDPPIFVCTDYEAMQPAEGEHPPIMVCCETDQADHTRVFYGEHCFQDLQEFLDQLAVNEDGFERLVIVMFHNLKVTMACLSHKNRTINIVWWKIKSVSTSKCFLSLSRLSIPLMCGVKRTSDIMETLSSNT